MSTRSARPLLDEPLLHAAWVPSHGLHWWVETPTSRRTTARRHPRALPASQRRTAAREWGPWSVVFTGAARTAWLLLPVRDGVPTTPDEPAEGLAPVQVPLVSSPTGWDLVALLGSSYLPLSPEVEYLRSLALDLQRLVQTGRVVPAVAGHRATWRLVDDSDVLAWRQGRERSMPAALRSAVTSGDVSASWVGQPAPDVLWDVLERWIPELVTRAVSPQGGGDLVTAFRTAAGVDGTALAQGLEEWSTSKRVRSFRLTLRLDEPSPSLDDRGGPSAHGDRWPLEVLLRIDDDAPVGLATLRLDDGATQALQHSLQVATHLVPALRTAEEDPFDPGRRWLPTATVSQLIDGGQDTLRRHGIEVLLPRAWSRRDTSLRLDVGSHGESQVGLAGLVSWEWSVAVGDAVLTEQELLRLSEEKTDLVRLRGEWVRLDVRQVANARRRVTGRGASAPLADLLHQLLADELPAPVGELRATGWIRGLFDTGAGVADVAQPSGLTGELRTYQRRGLAWLAFMDQCGLGAVLADDMGLGKTIQVLSLLLHEREVGTSAGPTLLVAPTSLLTNWAREAGKFAPGLRVLVHHGRERRSLLDLPAVDLVVTSYGVALRDVDDLRTIHWHRLVLDEAHYVKNSAGRQAAAIRRIPSTRRLALTGTPVENRLLELRGIMDTVNPGMLGSEASFRTRFSTPIEKHRDPIAVSRLQALTRPFILRREKTDRSIVSDLPDKIEQIVPVNLTAEQAALYRARVDRLLADLPTMTPMQRRATILATLTQLKQICNHPAHYLGDGSPLLRRGTHRSGKLAVLDDLVTTALDGGEQMLLFTQFTAFGEMLRPHLEDAFGLEVPFLQGRTPRSKRDAMVTGFQDGASPLLMLSLRAGGTGLNLTAASQVVHVDRWWNPSVENQATDRAYRIGQQRVVNVHKLMAVGTVEERIDALIAGKSELAALAVSADENWITELGTDALRELLTLDPGTAR